jgi:hypothetical protein
VFVRRTLFLALSVVLVALPAAAELTINDDRTIVTDQIPFVIRGTADPNQDVTVEIAGEFRSATADIAGNWSVTWDAPLRDGTYAVNARAGENAAGQTLRIRIREDLQRRPGTPDDPVRYADPQTVVTDATVEMTDRWRIAPPPYELDEKIRGPKTPRGATLDPYNQNLLKGDLPIRGQDTFLVLTGISDSLLETRAVPTPSGVSSNRPDSFPFFGDEDQSVVIQNIILSGDIFEGDTAFLPVKQRLKATIIGNLNYVRLEENQILKPDSRRGNRRTDGRVSIQELFYERKLRDLTPNFDFVSMRIGSQPFTSDFRGFVFTDTNLGVRFFGDYALNRFQYNLAFFDRLEKDTNSGLNINNERREQQVAVANFYWQDFIWPGFTQQFSLHYMHDEPTFKFDRNGILVRPAPVGIFTPHEIDAGYIGMAGLGHRQRLNIDYALYYVFGRDTLNPIAGPDPTLREADSVRIGAGMAALELSYEKDWYRPRFAIFYATGDDEPRDRKARGFDSIFDNPVFAGGGFSFYNRLGIRLTGSGVTLVDRGSLLNSLRSSKDEGQPNYVNPGIQLASLGLDVEVTPRLKAIATANYIRMDAPESVEALLFQGDISKELGADISLGFRYRPYLNQNVILVAGGAAFIPGQGFEDIYESRRTLFHFFTNLILTY